MKKGNKGVDNVGSDPQTKQSEETKTSYSTKSFSTD